MPAARTVTTHPRVLPFNYYKRGYRSNPLLDSIRPEVNLKQKWFLSLEDLEVMFGGSAGGSKSDSLLMAALQYIDVPGYAAIIFRRTYEDLSLPGALMDRASQLLTGTCLIKRDGGRRWEHPDGGVLQFGYLADDNDRYRYQSAEFTFCAFDELTQFPEDSYRYLFSRLRRPSSLSRFPELSHVPLRMRSATNPGGTYGEWVKHAFISKKYLESPEEDQFSRIWVKESRCLLCSGIGHIEIGDKTSISLIECPACHASGWSRKVFVPARKSDNRFLDQAAYALSLANLPPAERAALEHGRWDVVSEGNLFRAEWRRNYRWQGQVLVLPKPGMNPDEYHSRNGHSSTDWFDYLQPGEYWYFLTADTANKTKTMSDYTVISVWAVGPNQQLCWIETIRQKMLIPNILPVIDSLYKKYKARFVIIEDASSGIGVIQSIQSDRSLGLTVIPFTPGNADKVYRSQPAQIMLRTGRIYFPTILSSVQQDCWNELLLFPESEHDDFVDTLSMAAWWCESQWHQQAGRQPPAHQLRPGIRHTFVNRY